jgi:hypothetical protein
MSRRAAKDKRLVVVPSNLVKGLMEVSSREGKPFHTFIGEVFEQVLRAYEMGRSLKEIVDFFELVEAQKSAGALFTPMDVLNYLIGKVYPVEGEVLQEKWYESGQWYGKYLIAKFDDPVDALGRILAAVRWDLNEVKVTREGNSVKMRCVSTVLPIEGTELLLKFIEGAMHSLGYKTKKQDYLKGIIFSEFEKV